MKIRKTAYFTGTCYPDVHRNVLVLTKDWQTSQLKLAHVFNLSWRAFSTRVHPLKLQLQLFRICNPKAIPSGFTIRQTNKNKFNII